MIRYQKIGIDEDSIRLLGKLGRDFPLSSLLLDIENKHLTINKVFYDDKLYGILVLKAIHNRRGELMLVVHHAIAEDRIEKHFTSILVESFVQYAFKHGFQYIRFHANRDGIYKILRKHCGKPLEFVFQIEAESWIQTANQVAHNKHLLAQRTPV